MSSTLLLPPREQLCNRSCSNKHTHTGTTPGVPLLFFFFTFESAFGHERTGRSRGNLARTPDVAVVIPLKLVYTPVDATVTAIRNYQVPTLVRDERTHPHRPRLVVYHSTCRPLSSSPPANSFVIGPAVINTHTPVPLLVYLCCFSFSLLRVLSVMRGQGGAGET